MRKEKIISKEKQGRIYTFDHMKAFLIFCVVLGHIAYWFPKENYLLHCTQLWIYFFHMPAFIFLAGLFSKKIIDAQTWDKIIPYIFLYIFMKSIIYFVDVFRLGSDKTKIDFFHAVGVEWFALSLFWCYVITIAIRRVHPVYIIIVSVCMSMLAGYTDADTSFMVWQRTVTFYPFFYLGYILETDKLMNWRQVHKKIKIVLSIAFLVFLYAVIYFCYTDHLAWLKILRGYFSYQEIFGSANLIYGGLYRLLAYVISFVLVFALIILFPNRRICGVLTYIGSRTLPVYALHSPMIPLLFALSSGHIKTVMLETNLFITSILLSIFLCIITSLPIFDNLLRKLIEVPQRDK